jgi:hypothetical protein
VIDHAREAGVAGDNAECGCQAFGASADDVSGFIHAQFDAQLIGAFKFTLKGLGVGGTFLLFGHCGKDFVGDDFYDLLNELWVGFGHSFLPGLYEFPLALRFTEKSSFGLTQNRSCFLYLTADRGHPSF